MKLCIERSRKIGNYFNQKYFKMCPDLVRNYYGILKIFQHIFCATYHCFRDINISNLLRSKRRSRLWNTFFAMSPPFNDKYRNLQMSPTHSCAKSYCFRHIKVKIITFKGRSMLRSIIFIMTPFDDKCEILQMCPTHFLRKLLPFQRYAIYIYFFTFNKYVKVAWYNLFNDTFRWQMQKSTTVSHTFMCYILPFQIYYC